MCYSIHVSSAVGEDLCLAKNFLDTLYLPRKLRCDPSAIRDVLNLLYPIFINRKKFEFHNNPRLFYSCIHTMTPSTGSNTEAPNSLLSQSHSSLELRHPLIIRAISPLFWGLPLLHYDHLQEISKSTKMVKDWNDYIYKVRANWKSLSIVSQ